MHKNVDICMLNATSTSHEVIQANLHVQGETDRERGRRRDLLLLLLLLLLVIVVIVAIAY